jgi:hypothetical protein
MKDHTTRRSLRSAIYTRVSTDQGLDRTSTPSMPNERLQRPTSKARRMRAGDWFGIITTTAASLADRWFAQLSRNSSPTCRRDGST